MRILLVGHGNHQFIKSLAKKIKETREDSVTVDLLSISSVSPSSAVCYDCVFQIKSFLYDTILKRIKGVRLYSRLILYYFLLKRLPDYDFVHFQYLGIENRFLLKQVSRLKKNHKILVTIWGSDYYKLKPKFEKSFLDACEKAHKISFTNPETKDHFTKKFNWVKNNLCVVRFGLEPLDFLMTLNEDKNKYKESLGWDIKKNAIVIGYNLSPYQQHLEVLKVFRDSSLIKLKDRILLILPLTYGGSNEYKDSILECLKKMPYEYVVYDTFLKDSKVALIRKATDIMIQVQVTDQFSGSMQEHLFANNIVITGSWLPYRLMKTEGAWFLEVDEINQLSNVLEKVMDNYLTYNEKTQSNSQVIANLSSWSKTIEMWNKLYR